MTPEQIIKARRELRLSRKGLALALGMPASYQRTVLRWEQGAQAMPANVAADLRDLLAKVAAPCQISLTVKTVWLPRNMFAAKDPAHAAALAKKLKAAIEAHTIYRVTIA